MYREAPYVLGAGRTAQGQTAAQVAGLLGVASAKVAAVPGDPAGARWLHQLEMMHLTNTLRVGGVLGMRVPGLEQPIRSRWGPIQ